MEGLDNIILDIYFAMNGLTGQFVFARETVPELALDGVTVRVDEVWAGHGIWV